MAVKGNSRPPACEIVLRLARLGFAAKLTSHHIHAGISINHKFCRTTTAGAYKNAATGRMFIDHCHKIPRPRTMATSRQHPWGQRYDPYSSPITLEAEGAGDYKVLLFPFTSSSSPVATSSRPERSTARSLPLHEICHRSTYPIRNINTSAVSSDGSVSSEIEDLRRRLHHIKVRRAMQIEHTMEIQRDLEEMERRKMVKESKNINESPEISAARTAEESIELTTESFNKDTQTNSRLNPMRLLCSIYKAQHVTPSPPHERMNRSRENSHESQSIVVGHDCTKLSNLWDSLVCVNRAGPLDPIFCISRPDDAEDTEPRRITTIDCQQHKSDFDPYYSRPSMDVEAYKPRGRVYGTVGDDDTGCFLDGLPSKSCSQKRFPAWYQRPDKITTDASTRSHVMQMVFYGSDNQFDGQKKLCQDFHY